MWIKLEDKISFDVEEDNFFPNELPEKSLRVFLSSAINKQSFNIFDDLNPPPIDLALERVATFQDFTHQSETAPTRVRYPTLNEVSYHH